MRTVNLTPTYTATPEDADRLPDLRLTLEPEYIDPRAALANLADIDAMLAAARSGASAHIRQMENCRWARMQADGTVHVRLSVMVWPSEPGLQYRLTAPANINIQPGIYTEKGKHRKYWVSGGGAIELPWCLQNAALRWHSASGCRDAWSNPAPAPGLRQNRARIEIDGDRVFGVLQVTGTAVGFLHYLEFDARKIEEQDGRRIITGFAADSFEVQAEWTDEKGETRTESATVDIPPCVKALLERCAGGGFRFRTRDDSAPPVTVYYSTCDGSVLAVRKAKE